MLTIESLPPGGQKRKADEAETAGPSATYNIPMALRLEGDLDVAAMEAALADVLARHESLRTIFPEHDGVPFQEILPVEVVRPGLLTEAVTEATLPEHLTQAGPYRHRPEPRTAASGMAVPA